MNRRLVLICLLILAGIIITSIYISKFDKNDSFLDNNQEDEINGDEGLNDTGSSDSLGNSQINNGNNIVGSSGGAPTPGKHTLEILNFNVNFPSGESPNVNVNAGDEVRMILRFQSFEDIERATIQPWLYRTGREPVTSGITQGLPSELYDLKRNQYYEYEFTLSIPESPEDARYAFVIFTSGCSSSSCGSAGPIDFIVGDGAPSPASGDIIVIA